MTPISCRSATDPPPLVRSQWRRPKSMCGEHCSPVARSWWNSLDLRVLVLQAERDVGNEDRPAKTPFLRRLTPLPRGDTGRAGDRDGFHQRARGARLDRRLRRADRGEGGSRALVRLARTGHTIRLIGSNVIVISPLADGTLCSGPPDGRKGTPPCRGPTRLRVEIGGECFESSPARRPLFPTVASGLASFAFAPRTRRREGGVPCLFSDRPVRLLQELFASHVVAKCRLRLSSRHTTANRWTSMCSDAVAVGKLRRTLLIGI
jgi:hypothetical protein